MEGDIVLQKHELERLGILHMVLAKKMSQKKASRMMDISFRQTKRLIKRIKRHGDQSIVHASRGKPSGRVRSCNNTFAMVGRCVIASPDPESGCDPIQPLKQR